MTTDALSQPTPSIVINLDRLKQNIRRMQEICTLNGVELWPHIKAHKMVEVARLQLDAGATGLSCAKLSEAEAMLRARPKRLFIANALVDPVKAPRLRELAFQIETLVVACTSEAHFHALEELLSVASLRLPVMMAAGGGFGREGICGHDAARRLAKRIAGSDRMKFWGIYTHEGPAGGDAPQDTGASASNGDESLIDLRDSIDQALRLWPGCSATAEQFATLTGIQAVRPGAYVFGDLAQTTSTHVMDRENVALHVHAQVIDLPARDLALIDAGSKVFGNDKTSSGLTALSADGKNLEVFRCNEEHGYVRGIEAANLKIGQKLAFIPAYICPVVNLTDRVKVVNNGKTVDRWKVDARGCVT